MFIVVIKSVMFTKFWSYSFGHVNSVLRLFLPIFTKICKTLLSLSSLEWCYDLGSYDLLYLNKRQNINGRSIFSDLFNDNLGSFCMKKNIKLGNLSPCEGGSKFNWKKKIHIPPCMVSKNLSVCPSVINFDPNYLRTDKTKWAKKAVSQNFLFVRKNGPKKHYSLYWISRVETEDIQGVC